MPEPITTLLVTAAALGAAAGLKPAVEQAVKDTYAAFKRLITDHYGDYRDLIDSLEFLAKKPSDPARQAAVGTELTNAKATEDIRLIEAAKAVHAAIEAHSPDTAAAIGLEIKELKAAVLEVEQVQAGKTGTAVRIEKADIAGPASFKNIGRDPDPN